MADIARSIVGAAAIACTTVFIGIGATVGTSAQTLDRIMDDGRIVIGIHNSAPWGFRDENGEPAGFHPDLIEAAFSELGVTEVEIVITEFGALIPGLLANRFDLIASGLYITPERCELVAFSDPDLMLADSAVVLEGNPYEIHGYDDIASNPDLTFAAGRGSVTAANATEAGVPEDRQLLFPNIQSTISALLTGRVYVAVYSAPTVIRIMSDPNIEGLERATPFQGLIQDNGLERSGYSAIAFRLDDADLRDLYNQRLAEMKADGTVEGIMDRYGFTEEETAPDLTQTQICNPES